MVFVLLTYAYALVNWASHGMNGTESSDAKLNQVRLVIAPLMQ